MEFERLLKSELLGLCDELGVETSSSMKKSEIIDAIRNEDLPGDEIGRMWAKLKAQKEEEATRANLELEKLRLEVELRKTTVGSGHQVAGRHDLYDMTKLIQTYKVEQDMGLYLVNFERACEKARFAQDSWPRRLLSVLPCEAAEVIARLSAEDADDYAKVKSSLLKRYRLSAEAFRQKFRNATKRSDASYAEFAYELRCYLVEWMKGADSYESKEKMLETVALEQFYKTLPESMRTWIQDKTGVDSVHKAADLADEHSSRRGGKEGTGKPPEMGHSEERRKNWKRQEFRQKTGESKSSQKEKEGASGKEREDRDKKKAFEAKKPITCFNCHEAGHIAAGCRKPKVVFACASESEENEELLGPYLYTLTVNGKSCRVLRDSGATIDVVHPDFVTEAHYNGKCSWIRSVIDERSLCLPVADILISGPFGEVRTEAAVSDKLPPQYPYLFSNRTEKILRDQGRSLGEGLVQALTRSKARGLSTQLAYDPPKKVLSTDELLVEAKVESSRARTDEANTAVSRETGIRKGKEDDHENVTLPDEVLVPPSSNSFHKLVRVTRETLMSEQNGDPSLARIWETSKEGVARKNVSFPVRDGVLYRHYRDRRGRTFDQLVVPEKYRADVLRLCHGAGWLGHLGNKKTKERLLSEFYWPGCFRDAENQVRACDVCQRVGKPNEKSKAPLRLVPLISEPFQRLVIDVVGPLPTTKTGYRYVLTMLCAATKFPEAVPLRELTSVEIVKALLDVFARVGFPREIQCDQGTVFTSALTTGFLEKCGIKIIHSSVYHPQTNSVERWHSVMKRVLRALIYENKCEWEACLPAMLFALRSVAHEATGFSPAELVYGRGMRSPIRLLRESWESRGSDPTVVEYILALLERFRSSREIAETNMRASQERAKRYYDKNARFRQYSEGDAVLLLRPSRANKLEVQWEGPFRVAQKLSDTNYAIERTGRRKSIQIYHCNLMKPYVSSPQLVNIALNGFDECELEVPQLGEPSDGSVGVEEIMALAVQPDQLTASQLTDLRRLLGEFEGLFSEIPGKTSVVTHDMELTSGVPIRCRPYRMAPRQQDILKTEIERMLKLGVIVPCESEYTSPMILVEAPGKDPRPCVDYRKLNAITKDQIYPIPHIEERVERVSGAQFVSILDLVRGYWQVPMTERASQYAAFVTPSGTFRPTVLSFGLKNAPFCFSRLMDRVLRGAETYALPYLDDVAIFSATWEDHLRHLRDVFSRLREAGLTIKPKKCQLAKGEVRYLGHVVGQGRRRPDELKVEAVNEFPRPVKKTGIRAFLGLTGYYQRYIPRYSELASPLTDALRKGAPEKVAWTEEMERAFRGLQAALCSAPVLRTPDYNRPFIVQCDASNRGLGVILCQEDDRGEEHPVLYASRKLSTREEAYSASEKECACLIWATQKLSCYLYGAPFVFVTDHCPLTWLTQMSSKNARLLRWSLALQQLNFTVKYKKGTANGNVDGLSRSF